MSAKSAAMNAAAARVAVLAEKWTAPAFEHVPDPDSALFLCAVDHKTGYDHAHTVAGDGPYSGSELMWMMGLRAAAAEPGLLTAARLSDVSGEDIARWFDAGGETVADPDRRAAMWRDLAVGMERDHEGQASRLLAASAGRLGGDEGLVALLARYDAYSDPLAKKAFLLAKIAERRGWFEVSDPEAWEVSADNVLMRLALRSGLVAPGALDEVRSATRDALKALAAETGLSPPVLDDLLWELGRDDPDLLGRAAGELAEPGRNPDSHWY